MHFPTDRKNAPIYAAVRALNDPDTEFSVTAERAVLHALGGGCQLPLGAFAHVVDEQWELHAMVAAPDGEEVAHVVQRVPFGADANELGEAAAEALRARGALELLGQAI
jgi:hydroxymethylbilane synthase